VLPSEKQGFTLDNFEGTLDLLLYLVQKHELDIGEVPLKEITSQFHQRLSFEEGGDFVAGAAALLLLKTQALLPEEGGRNADEDPDPRLEMLQHVIDYCQLKEKAKDLSQRELNIPPHFHRGTIETIPDKDDSLQLSLGDLIRHLDRALSRAKESTRTLQREEWRTEYALEEVRGMLKERQILPLEELFTGDKPRGHLIVLFLALLEMMKHQEIRIEDGQCLAN
jgi:segregation and condensation protein A